MNWFQDCGTVASVKALWRTLAKEHHPDMGGDCATMQDINAAYHAALNSMDGQESHDEQGRAHTYRYNNATEQAVMDKVEELLKARMAGIEIHLIGLWVWITGDTRPNKDVLKAMGCFWHSKRACWYWRPAEMRYYRKNAPRKSLDELAWTYGCQTFHEAKEQAVAVA